MAKQSLSARLKCRWLSWIVKLGYDSEETITNLQQIPSIKAGETLFHAFLKHRNSSDPKKFRYSSGLSRWSEKHYRHKQPLMDSVGRRYGVEVLISILEDEFFYDLKPSAVVALGELRDPRAVQPLLRIAHSGNAILQRVAIRELGNLSNPEISASLSALTPVLLKQVNYQCSRLWYELFSKEGSLLFLLEALHKLGGPAAIEPTLDMFRSAVKAVSKFKEVRIEVKHGDCTFGQEVVNVSGRHLIDLLSRNSHPDAQEILREIARVNEIEFEQTVVEHIPGDSEYEQLYHDGHGPRTEVTRRVIRFEELASMARQASQKL